MAQVKYTSVRWCEACGMMVNAKRVTVGKRTYSVCARCGAREEERWGWGAQAMKAINRGNTTQVRIKQRGVMMIIIKRLLQAGAVLGFVLVLGAVGGIERGDITVAHGVIQAALSYVGIIACIVLSRSVGEEGEHGGHSKRYGCF